MLDHEEGYSVLSFGWGLRERDESANPKAVTTDPKTEEEMEKVGIRIVSKSGDWGGAVYKIECNGFGAREDLLAYILEAFEDDLVMTAEIACQLSNTAPRTKIIQVTVKEGDDELKLLNLLFRWVHGSDSHPARPVA